MYSGTRNVYRDISASCKSLLLHSDVDRVYLLIEDDKFPEVLPDCVKAVNVSKQKYFKKTSPNFGCRWSYMVLLRAAYPKIFEKEPVSTILTIDCDAIVCRDVSELFSLDLGDNYLAGVAEPGKEHDDGEPYINMGVALMNLPLMLKDGIYDAAVKALNEKKYPFCEQDVFNELCAGRKLLLDPKYNISNWTRNSGETAIRHFAAETGWRDKTLVRQYDRIPWQEAAKGKNRG